MGRRAPLTLSARITLWVLVLFLGTIWCVSFIATRYLRHEIRSVVGSQQAATVRMVANQVNQELMDRILVMQSVAQLAADALESGPDAVEELLLSRYDLHALFNSRVYILDSTGTALAAWPVGSGPKGRSYAGLDYIEGALRDGVATIGRPLIGLTSREPTIPMAVSIRNSEGKIVGAIAGTINLTRPNFLDPIMENRHGATGNFVLVDTARRQTIGGTDKQFILQPLPAPGEDSVVDRLVSGTDTEAISDKPWGHPRLMSVHAIPVSGWQLGATLALDEVDGPIREVQRRIIATAIVLSLLAAAATWLMLRRLLHPLGEAARQLTELAAERSPLAPVLVRRNDEIGQLLSAFNHLIQVLGERETLLKQVLNATHVGICLMDCHGTISLANRAMSEMFGIPASRFSGLQYFALVPPEERERVRQAQARWRNAASPD